MAATLSVPRPVTVGDMLTGKNTSNLISVNSDTKLDDVSQLLKQHNILSVPVFDKTQNKFIGLIDVVALVQLTAKDYFKEMEARLKQMDINREISQPHQNPQKSAEIVNQVSGQIILNPSSFQFGDRTAADLVASSKRCQNLHIFQETETLETMMKALALYQQHRVLIDKAGNYFVLSQMDIVCWFLKQREIAKFGPATSPELDLQWQFASQVWKETEELLSTKLVDKGLVNPTGGYYTVAIDHTAKAIDGFFMMDFHNVPAVAIVDSSFKLLGTLSASDLRGLSGNNVDYLNLPVMEFIKKMTGKDVARPVTCTTIESLLDVMAKMAGSRVHRVWCVDSAERPIGVVSLTDVLKALTMKHNVHRK